jgi:hypothetical protein
MPPKQRARNLGSNFTAFRYAGKNIAYLEQVNDQGQRPVGQGIQSIHPLGHRHPTEFVTARAIQAGSLTLSIRELWHEEIWEQMAGLAGTKDIIEVFERLAAQQNYVTCTKIITPPGGNKYGKTYHRCVISDIADGETFDIGTLSVPKTITVAYTHTTKL